jgi:hypothetical protein
LRGRQRKKQGSINHESLHFVSWQRNTLLIYPLNEISSGSGPVEGNSKLSWHLSIAVCVCAIKWQMGFINGR